MKPRRLGVKLHGVPLTRQARDLIHAAAGGLGQLLIRWGKRLGARIIGTVGSEAKRSLALQAGAEEVLLPSEPSWPQRARQIADSKGVHLAVDGIGGAMLAQTLASVRPFGLTVSLGQPAGPIPPIKVEDLGAGRTAGSVILTV